MPSRPFPDDTPWYDRPQADARVDGRRKPKNVIPRVLGTSRYLVIFAVLGSFISSAALMVYGLIRAIGMIGTFFEQRATEEELARDLILDALSIVDIFLLGTVLYIISAGLYQLFVDSELKLPDWLVIRTIEDLKVRLAGVIVVGMIVAFLGFVVDWEGGTDIIAPALGIAAIIVAIGLYFRVAPETAASHTTASAVPTTDGPASGED
jgi:uncharacterized membrane protein YqhA